MSKYTEQEQKSIIEAAVSSLNVATGIARGRELDGEDGEYTLTMVNHEWLTGEGMLHEVRVYLKVAELRDWRDYPVPVVIKVAPNGKAIVDTY